MARTEARVTCAIWDDEDYRDLTWEAQWLYETLLTQKDLSLCGVLTYTPKRFAKLAVNASPPAIRKALDLLRERRYVVLDDDTDELLVRSLIRRDRVLSNHNSVIGCSKSFEAIHSQVVRDSIIKEVLRVVADGLAIGGTEGGTPTGWLRGLPDHVGKRVGQPFAKALALACTRPPPGAPIPPSSVLRSPVSPTSESRSSSDLSVVGERTAEEEEPDRVGQVCQLVAERRYGKLSDPPPPGIRRDRWLAATAGDVLAKRGPGIALDLAAGSSVDAIVDSIEPPATPAAIAVSPYPAAGEQPPPVFEIDDETGLAVPVSA